MLSQGQITQYHTDGFLTVEGVLDKDLVTELQEVTDNFVERSRAVNTHTDIFDLEPGHTQNDPRLRRLNHPVEQHVVYHRAMRDSNVLDIVAQLIGLDIRTNGNKLNMKSPGYGSAVEWHQDWAFYPHSNDDLLAVGVAMDDMTEENGCMIMIPGSHKGAIYDHHQDGRFVGAVTEEVEGADQAVPVEVRAGGITLHHVRTLHASAPNHSNKPRRLLLFQYCAVDSWPLIKLPDWKAFNADILRGVQTNQPRLEPVPVKIPLPPAERDSSIYESQAVLKKKILGGSQ
jgi:phytanoyl-CoA hydroxylase